MVLLRAIDAVVGHGLLNLLGTCVSSWALAITRRLDRVDTLSHFLKLPFSLGFNIKWPAVWKQVAAFWFPGRRTHVSNKISYLQTALLGS